MHDSPDDDKYFTLAYMHRPDDVAPELEAAQLTRLRMWGRALRMAEALESFRVGP